MSSLKFHLHVRQLDRIDRNVFLLSFIINSVGSGSPRARIPKVLIMGQRASIHSAHETRVSPSQDTQWLDAIEHRRLRMFGFSASMMFDEVHDAASGQHLKKQREALNY